MRRSDGSAVGMWCEAGGSEGPVVVLLHGSGATSAVWAPLLGFLPGSQRWLTVDLPGHGASRRLPSYSTGAVAAAVAEVLDPEDSHVVVGHSLGGQVALALADPLFGLRVTGVVPMAVKLSWTPDELEQRRQRSRRAPKRFEDRDAALTFFGRVSGLAEAAAPPTRSQLVSGVTELDGGFVLAQDPRTGANEPLPRERIVALAGSARCVTPVCGDEDALTSPSAMAALGPVEVVPGAGHNLHLTHPEAVADIVRSVRCASR